MVTISVTIWFPYVKRFLSNPSGLRLLFRAQILYEESKDPAPGSRGP